MSSVARLLGVSRSTICKYLPELTESGSPVLHTEGKRAVRVKDIPEHRSDDVRR